MIRYNISFMFNSIVRQVIQECTTNTVISMDGEMRDWQDQGYGFWVDVQPCFDDTVIGK